MVRWCSNLAAPDMLLNWSRVMPDFINHGSGMFGLGPYLNVLPIVTVGLYLWQQKVTMPPPADEQAAMQQTVMKYMMVFIGILFYKVASGLCLYFIASTLWSLGERKLLPKAAPAGGGAPVSGQSTPGQLATDAQQRGDMRKKERQKQRRN
jgi:YidC/Oxa1 family membrane protein insertase